LKPLPCFLRCDVNKQRLYERGIIFARYFLLSSFITALLCLIGFFMTDKNGFVSYASVVILPLCSFLTQGVSSFLLNPRSRKASEREHIFVPFLATFLVSVISHLIIYGFSLSKILFVFLYIFCGFLGAMFGLLVAGMKN